ncbi:MAG TPA: metallophosphoesterase [Tepidisphaeraceae bacterium]|jgi:hypothetical protein|nr:metallophosphoesterase [Tepidisphaeraceae bacterium]
MRMNGLSAERRPVTPAEAMSGRDMLRILVLPDLHIPFGPRQKELLLGNRAFLDAHDWVVLLGDMTACYGTPGEYAKVRDFIAALDRPYSVVNGNHEFSFVPQDDDDASAYAKVWTHSPATVGQSLLRRFEKFYGIESRYHANQNGKMGCVLLGVDSVATDSSARLDPEHEAWFANQLDEMSDVPLLVFCHFPLLSAQLDGARYYEAGRRPYYVPTSAVRSRLRRRSHATWWLSGHVHFAATHPLFGAYQTDDGVWQVHCPDGWGYGRRDNETWTPRHHDDLTVRSVHISYARQSVNIISTDLVTQSEVDSWSAGSGVPPRERPLLATAAMSNHSR